ncbi:hypothetical protein GCM10023107_34770 [Actinoplanes octamycinicus]|nr:hypothetical protein Aoc01nite_27990 [Actinoplanes octamycinicus]
MSASDRDMPSRNSPNPFGPRKTGFRVVLGEAGGDEPVTTGTAELTTGAGVAETVAVAEAAGDRAPTGTACPPTFSGDEEHPLRIATPTANPTIAFVRRSTVVPLSHS